MGDDMTLEYDEILDGLKDAAKWFKEFFTYYAFNINIPI
jgi:hypothetical protein